MKEESDRQFWEISTQEQIEIVDEESQKQCYEAAFAGIQEAMSKSVHDGKMQFQDEFILLLYLTTTCMFVPKKKKCSCILPFNTHTYQTERWKNIPLLYVDLYYYSLEERCKHKDVYIFLLMSV